MTLIPWPRRASAAAEGLFGYDASLLSEIEASIRRQRFAAALAIGAFAVGLALLVAGIGQGVGALGIGLLLAGHVDRRLMLLGALLIAPALTAFSGISLASIDGSTLDVRHVFTGTLAVVIWAWLAVDRPRPDAIAGVFVIYVAVALVLVLLNTVAPLKALPVLARDLVYLGAFIGARTWLGSARGANAVLVTATAGLLMPAVSGPLQWMTGGGLVAAGVWRLSGLYGTSPVGLALAMQLGVVVLAGSALTEGAAPRLRWVAGILALVLMAVILVQTSSRLPYLTAVTAVLVFEMARRRWIGAAVVLVLSALLMLSSAGLSARMNATFVPTATNTPAASTAPSPSGGVAAVTPETNSTAGAEDVGGGAASLRYRLGVWSTMLKEWSVSPLVGRGTGTFATLLEQRTGLHRVAPHNDYLYALVEGGALLFLLYLSVQVMVVSGLLARALTGADARLPLVALAVFGMTNIANSINNPIFFVDLQLVLWVIVGSVLAGTEHRVHFRAFLRRPMSNARMRDQGRRSPARLSGAVPLVSRRDGCRQQDGNPAPTQNTVMSSEVRGPLGLASDVGLARQDSLQQHLPTPGARLAG